MKKSLLTVIMLLGMFFILHDSIIAQITIDNGKFAFQLNSYGRLRIYSPTYDTSDQNINDQIDRFSILVSGNKGEVFDYYNDLYLLTGPDSVVAPEKSDYEIAFTGDASYNTPPLPPNVGEDMNVYSWKNVKYLIVKVVIKNLEASALAAHIGAEIIPWNGYETDEYDNATGILWTNTASYPYIGFKDLTQTLESVKFIDYYKGYNSSDSTLYANFVTNSIQAAYTTDSANGTVLFYSGAVTNLEPQATKTIWTAIALGDTKDEMKTNMEAAVAKYNTTFTSVKPIEGIPMGFVLTQNYPNPFNPTTKINFSLIKNEFVNLSVYNVLGQKVAELINSDMNVGNYSVDFNAGKLASGVYIYRLATPTQSVTKKMSLLK
jgi:hypothetical protein